MEFDVRTIDLLKDWIKEIEGEGIVKMIPRFCPKQLKG